MNYYWLTGSSYRLEELEKPRAGDTAPLMTTPIAPPTAHGLGPSLLLLGSVPYAVTEVELAQRMWSQYLLGVVVRRL
ncbi:TPA: hypothetical protein BOS_16601 [Bos taurus]|nr:TPA: hypothetical protein BOS_16601 [Bos taurus]